MSEPLLDDMPIVMTVVFGCWLCGVSKGGWSRPSRSNWKHAKAHVEERFMVRAYPKTINSDLTAFD
jgi:hypothetical protein